jgi:uroporphyrinogen decarboxylase
MVGRFRQDQRTVAFGMRASKAGDFAGYVHDVPPGTQFDEWGIGRFRSSTGSSADHVHPLAALDSPDEVHGFPFPDLSEVWRHADLEARIEAIHAQGTAAVGQMSQTFFELAMLMRGMEALFIDLYDNKPFVEALLDQILEQRSFQATRFAEAGVDVLRLGDDFGTQSGMIMSPRMWRKWFKPRLKRVIDAAREVTPDLPVKYHSDGRIDPIIPDLIEVGVTVLNPVQPEAMDPVEVKRAYGDRLALWGTVGVQSTLPFGTVEEVRATVRHRIETLGRRGGLVIAPTHSIQDDIPWENIAAFYDAVEEFGDCATAQA